MSYRVLADKCQYYQERVKELQHLNEHLLRMLIAKDLELTKLQNPEPEPEQPASEPVYEEITEELTPSYEYSWSPEYQDPLE